MAAPESTSPPRPHVPVLFRQVIEYLAPRPGGRYVDATVGAGGHAAGIVQASAPSGRVLGIDADPQALALAASTLAPWSDRVLLRHSNFDHLRQVAAENGFIPADGVLLDLGLSSVQLADEMRGFSFATHGALDMRFNPEDETTAADLVNSWPESELANLIFQYGEEPAARRIARAIVRARPIKTADQLALIVEKAVGRHGRIHPATRTFQALRMEVNQELLVLERVLPQTVDIVGVGGRIAVITFHSLEDRMVKYFFRGSSAVRLLTKHPIRPERQQVIANPRSRSAKLRAVERIM